MNYEFLVDIELDRIDWAHVQHASGSASAVPMDFRLLLAATNLEEAKRAYWKLENYVVVQGRLYEAAACLVPAICASLVDPDRPLFVRTWVIELLFQICSGYHLADTRSTPGTGMDIVDRCKNAARKSLWILYGELARQEIKITESLLGVLEDDADRLSLVKSKIPNYKAPVWSIGGRK